MGTCPNGGVAIRRRLCVSTPLFAGPFWSGTVCALPCDFMGSNPTAESARPDKEIYLLCKVAGRSVAIPTTHVHAVEGLLNVLGSTSFSHIPATTMFRGQQTRLIDLRPRLPPRDMAVTQATTVVFCRLDGIHPERLGLVVDEAARVVADRSLGNAPSIRISEINAGSTSLRNSDHDLVVLVPDIKETTECSARAGHYCTRSHTR